MREQMTRLHGQLDHLSITAPEAIRIELPGLSLSGGPGRQRPTGLRQHRERGLHDQDGDAGPCPAMAGPARGTRPAPRHQIQQLAAQSNPALLVMPGVGPDTSAALLIAAGDNPARLRSSAALAGVSPIEASSGKKPGHRGAAAATGW